MVSNSDKALTASTPQELEKINQDLQETGTAKLTQQAIATITEQMNLAEDLVNRLLHPGIDYGVTPGTQGPGLWDAGASKIIRAFRTYAEHKIIYHEESDDLVSWTIEAQLVNFAGEIVGSGLGNASTRETKYKYRWVRKEDALREGNTEEELAEFKTKTGYDGQSTLYRIHNPEFGELVHTLLVMASKRAEVDAAKSLPGVASALRAKFDNKQPQTQSKEDMTLPIFWSMMKGSGLTEDDVHRTLQVKSVKEWLEKGKLLRDAATYILSIGVKAARAAKAAAAKSAAPDTPAPSVKKPQQITKDDVPDLDALVALAQQYWDMTEEGVFKSLGYSDRKNFNDAAVQTPFEAWQALLEQQSG